MKRALVCGAGGMIGNRMAEYLKARGYYVVGADVKQPEFNPIVTDEFHFSDLRDAKNVELIFSSHPQFDECYQFSALMGGMGFVSSHHTEIMHDSTLINVNMIDAASRNGVGKYFFSSSACAYPEDKQSELGASPLKESDAYPASPADGYGWEKLYTERLCHYYFIENVFETRVARFHNCYGERSTWRGGKEKAPSAICRKVAMAKLTGASEIEIWGDGLQERTFMHVSDCVEGIYRLVQSNFPGPLNIGSTESVTINEMARMIMDIAGVDLDVRHVPGPEGVRSRNSDNTLCRKILSWEPSIPLRDGLTKTYWWIEEQVRVSLSTT